MTFPKILCFGYGNPGRGDDALGPRFIEEIEKGRTYQKSTAHLECLTDFQLQIEHTEDLLNRDLVLFVDAHLTASAPFVFQRIQGDPIPHFSTHALSPQSLIALHEAIHGKAPPSFLLGIRGESFDLGAPLSRIAENHLLEALKFSSKLLTQASEDAWGRLEISSS